MTSSLWTPGTTCIRSFTISPTVACCLQRDGEILMDDFAPTEPFGLGTCIVAAHATRVFAQVEVIESNGLIFEDAYFGFTRGMVHLAGIKRATLELDSVSLLAARVLGKAVEGLFHPKLLPVRLS